MSFSERAAAAKKSIGNWCKRVVANAGTIALPLAAVFFLGFVLAAALFGPVGPEWLTFDHWRDAKGTTSKSEIFRNLALSAAAVIGLGFGIWRSFIAQIGARTARLQASLTEQGQITDRYTEAVGMLADENPRTRVGAVYALARIAQDSIARDHIPVMEVLTEFIRNPPYAKEAAARTQSWEAWAEQDNPGDDIGPPVPPAIPCPDIHAALSVIAARNTLQKSREAEAEFSLTLQSAKLQELDLTGAHLAEADLTDANLTAANLTNANLPGAFLPGANLTRARITFARLSGATLVQSNLTAALLNGAALDHANLLSANLRRANLTDARLTLADLTRADLTHADLNGARLDGARLDGANLTDAHLIGADLNGAKLNGAKLTDADLTAADLAGADLSNARAGFSDAKLILMELGDANLTIAERAQSQLVHAWPSAPPAALPDGVEWPFVETAGKWMRKE